MFIFTQLYKYIVKKNKQPYHYVSHINTLEYGFLTKHTDDIMVEWSYLNKSQSVTTKIVRKRICHNGYSMMDGYHYEYYLLDIYINKSSIVIEPAILYQDVYYIKLYTDNYLDTIIETDIVGDFQIMLGLCFRRLMVHNYYDI